MSLRILGKHVAASGLLYETARRSTDPADVLTVAVGNWNASKSVKEDATPAGPGMPPRWRSQAGEVFDSLDEVAESMSWAVQVPGVDFEVTS